MARKRMRRRRDPHTTLDGMNQGHHIQPSIINGELVQVRQVGSADVQIRHISRTDEGVLYSHAINERTKPTRRQAIVSTFTSMGKFFSRGERSVDGFLGSQSDTSLSLVIVRRNSFSIAGNLRANFQKSKSKLKGIKQYTIKKKKRFKFEIANWMDRMNFPFMNFFAHCCSSHEHYNPDEYSYRPGVLLFNYINWTFRGTWTEIFMTFFFIYFAIMLLFAVLFLIAGKAHPACIVVAGTPFGDNMSEDFTLFNDAFALSYTTFTTVGYGMIYSAVGNNFVPNGPTGEFATKPSQCSWVVMLCTTEAFLGLCYAGMCAAILFGKVNRVQSHANVIFSNAVCLQYEWVREQYDFEGDDDDDDDADDKSGTETQLREYETCNEDVENPSTQDTTLAQSPPLQDSFIDQYDGCPVLKFQVINERCNKQGGEIVDAIMKVIGVKFKKDQDRITRSEYVRVNLVDFEHPFFSRVWHGVHILDASSPLLTDEAKRTIRQNNGSWPSSWFVPDAIREKLDFHDLIVTVMGISNVSAVTVHAYKQYKIGDVLIGYNFAPLVFRDKATGVLEVDRTLENDVREQQGLQGEDLSVRRMGSVSNTTTSHALRREDSTIRVTRAASIGT